jgi:RNA polymerase sigma factor (TIGR02999 family)
VDDERISRATAILSTLGDADDPGGRSAEELMGLVYDDLRRIAGGMMARERPGHTLQATALVNEAYLRMVDQSRVDWRGRTHFRAVGARVMRRILVDHARRHRSLKRGGEHQRVTLADSLLHPSSPELDLPEVLSLHDALVRLAEMDERQARVVELRVFGGLTASEVAEALGVSKRTVEGDWMHGRAWLRRELARGEGG